MYSSVLGNGPQFPTSVDLQSLEIGGVDDEGLTDFYPSEMDTEAEESRLLNSFEIGIKHIGKVKRKCLDEDFPLLEEYDFRNDFVNPNLDIDLKPTTVIRPYQSLALSKMFGNNRARSGIIVLPCGAGKTLVGITAASTIKKNTLVFCSGGVSVNQWREQFLMWTTLDPSRISRFTSDEKSIKPGPGVTITTYTMVGKLGKRAELATKVIEELQKQEWGLILLDEVHVFPATSFQTVINKFAAHCKLGLTATLLREDNRIQELAFLIGPKLYEANWLDLIRAGFLARVQCAAIWCPMVPTFFASYLSATDPQKKKILAVMNPNKLQACEFLIRFHELRGDKILVFVDDIWPLKTIARKFGREFLAGDVKHADRTRIFKQFRNTSKTNTIFISKVGDVAIDLPEATVLIQVSSHFGSRRQEAQRLGRILRPKGRGLTDGIANAFFYTLVSPDTREMYFATKRQEFLINQGYTFKNVDSASLPYRNFGSRCFETEKEQIDLLAQVLGSDSDKEIEESQLAAQRRAGDIASVSGATGRNYNQKLSSVQLIQKRIKKAG